MRLWVVGAALLGAALAGCGSAEPSDGESADTATFDYTAGPAGAVPMAQTPRARTVEDTISIEGSSHRETGTLLRPPVNLRFPFTTYTPPGIETTFDSDPAGTTVTFTAAFGGTPNPAAYMSVRLYPPGTPPVLAEDIVSSFLQVRAPGNHEFRRTEQPRWADATYSFSYDGSNARIHGSVTLARHGNRLFYVLRHYPGEYGDGLAPRLQRILEQWRWEDTGAMLVR